MSAPETKRTAVTGPVRVALVTSGRDPYAMFDIDGVDASALRVRGPFLLEVGEEISLRVERGNQSMVVRARVASHDRNGHGEAVTTLRWVGDSAAVRRLIGS